MTYAESKVWLRLAVPWLLNVKPAGRLSNLGMEDSNREGVAHFFHWAASGRKLPNTPMTIKLHCDDESGRTLKINIAPCLCRPYTQASEIGWGGVPWGRYVGGRSCAPNMFNHNRRSNFLRAASPQPGKNTSPARGPGDAHSTLDIFFFALGTWSGSTWPLQLLNTSFFPAGKLSWRLPLFFTRLFSGKKIKRQLGPESSQKTP